MYSIYKHKQNDELLCYQSFLTLPAHERRMIRLRQKILYNSKFATKWITLTYSDEHLDSDYHSDIANFIKRLRYHLNVNREAITDYYKDKLFEGSTSLQYLWRFETNSKGKRSYNPHFHLILNVVPYIENRSLREIWNRGFVHINKIDNVRKLRHYISKYMSKDKSIALAGNSIPKCISCANSHCSDRGTYESVWNEQKLRFENPSSVICPNFIGREKSWSSSRGYKKPVSEWKYMETLPEVEAYEKVIKYNRKKTFKYAGVFFRNMRDFL